MAKATPTHPLSFQPFYEAHRGRVLRLLVGMVGEDAALDCYQDVWLKVLGSWPPREVDGRLDSWVLTIAHHAAIDSIRRAAKETPVAEVPDTSMVVDQIEAAHVGPSALAASLAALAPRQRIVVVLRVVLDMSHAQVAAVLECSEDAARRSFADAMANLRRARSIADQGAVT